MEDGRSSGSDGKCGCCGNRKGCSAIACGDGGDGGGPSLYVGGACSSGSVDSSSFMLSSVTGGKVAGGTNGGCCGADGADVLDEVKGNGGCCGAGGTLGGGACGGSNMLWSCGA